jgi:glycosyltransferase involved in cell wall biosynthesis
MACIYNGNDMEQFDPAKLQKGNCKKRYGIKPEKKIISYVARMAWIKRPLLFVDAAKILVDKGLAEDLMFVMAGDGKDTNDVKARIQSLGMQDKFILTGSIPQNEVRELLADSYMFWLVSELEGLALVAVEAMSMNVPIVSTDVGAMNEAIENGKNGFLVHPYNNVAGDVAAIAEKMLKDPQLYNSIAQESRKSVLAKFSMDVMVENYDSIFNEMLNDREERSAVK